MDDLFFGMALARGSTALEAMGGAPYSVIVVLFTLSVVAIAASYGVWHQQRWAMVLTIMAAVVNLLAALPGILFAPTWYWQLSSATYVITGIAVVILCLWRERALATR